MSDDIHALSGAYAVDALDDGERAEFEQHLAVCDACRHEVDSLREAAAVLAATTLSQPSAELRDRVLAGIATVRPLPPEVGERTAAPATGSASVTSIEKRRRGRAATFLAAAAAVVAIGTGGVVWHSVSGSDSGPRETVAHQVMTAPDHETHVEKLAGGITVTLYRSKSLHEAVLVTTNMPPAPAGHDYVAWLQRGLTMTPAAVMPKGPDNTVVLGGDASDADGVGITVETAGDTPSKPSDQVVGVFPFASA